ncbi:MAG: amidase [Phycisphaerales bacterium]|nr:amidase [Phycisphaerales bacterium]
MERTNTGDCTTPQQSKQTSRRKFVAHSAFFAALGASTAFAQDDEAPTAAIKHAGDIAGIRFTDEEQTQILKTIQEQKDMFAARAALGELPNSLSPATTFNPVLSGNSLNTVTPMEQEGSLPQAGPCPTDDTELAFAPVWKLSQWLRNREVTSEHLTRLCIRRLKHYNKQLKCVVTFMDNHALGQARQADKELDSGKWRGPLHGVPWGAKDIIDTAGEKTTYGAAPFKNRVAEKDAVVVERLNDAGAVLVAKLSVGALAMGDVWFGGTCKNPFDVDEGSSGSSAGSASATAAGLVPFTLGSETYGSIVSPCMFCGTTGLRPTFGRVARTGVMALCWSLDKIGPICRSVLDTALVLEVINGSDIGDPSSRTLPFQFNPSQDAKGLRLGYDPKEVMSASEANQRELYFEKIHPSVLEAAEKAGMTLVRVEKPALDSTPLLIPLLVESAAAFEELTRSGRDDLLVSQEDNAWPNTFRQSWLIPAVEHIQASRYRREAMQQMYEWLNSDFDGFLTPGYSDLLLTANNTGQPATVFRTGMLNGKPLATTIIGRLFDEATILRMSMALEDEIGVSTIRPPVSS